MPRRSKDRQSSGSFVIESPRRALPELRIMLVLEPGWAIPRYAADALGGAGVDLVRISSPDRAVAFLRSVVIDGLIFVLSDPLGTSSSTRPGIRILSVIPASDMPTFACIAPGARLSLAEQELCPPGKSIVIDSRRLEDAEERAALLQHFGLR